MAETGLVRFPGSLDPRAEEFTPRNPTLFRPTQLYYPYAPTGGLQLQPQPLPFCDAVGVLYSQFSVSTPAAYVAPLAAAATPPVAPCSTTPTRSLLLSSVPAELVSESTLRRELEVFGDVRGVQMERVLEGIVTVHFYDLRHAEAALMAIRKQHMQQQTRLRNYYASLLKSRNSVLEAGCYALAAAPLPPPARGLLAGRTVWAQYVVPAHNAVPDAQNQGTIVIFNLDSEVSPETVRQTFEAFGPVKELRDTPSKKNQRFVEFFDIRDAAKALKDMNGKQIHGKPVVIEFSRPGGHGRKFFNPSAISKHNVLHSVPPLNFPPQSPALPPNSPPPLPRKNTGRFAPVAPPRSHLLKKSSVNKGISNSNSNSNSSTNPEGVSKSDNSNPVSVETSMGSTNLSEEVGNNGVEEKPGMKNYSSETKQQAAARSRNWKGKQGKKQETRFLIKEDAIVESSLKDSRTTVMIKNIPNKYSQKLLLNMLDNHCIHCNEQIGEGDDQPLSSYDFVYLPIDFNNKCNVGYGFVNMTSPEATLRLYKAFHLQHWEVFNSRKICEVTYARVQGLEALKEHFKNSKFPCEMEHYLPVVFSPPRDGRQLTEPLPIVGQKQQAVVLAVDDNSKAAIDDMHSSSSSSQNGAAEGEDDRRSGGEVEEEEEEEDGK